MLGQSAEQEEYAVLEDVVDWSGLQISMKRRKIPELVQKLITVYGPSRQSLMDWKQDFKKTKRVQEISVPKDEKQVANVAEPAHTGDDAEQPASSFDQIELDVFMMESETDSEFVLMPGDESVTGGVAATAVAVCATCRMLLGQCECRPRQRKGPQAAQPKSDVCLPCKQEKRGVHHNRCRRHT